MFARNRAEQSRVAVLVAAWPRTQPTASAAVRFKSPSVPKCALIREQNGLLGRPGRPAPAGPLWRPCLLSARAPLAPLLAGLQSLGFKNQQRADATLNYTTSRILPFRLKDRRKISEPIQMRIRVGQSGAEVTLNQPVRSSLCFQYCVCYLWFTFDAMASDSEAKLGVIDET